MRGRWAMPNRKVSAVGASPGGCRLAWMRRNGVWMRPTMPKCSVFPGRLQ